MLIISVKHRQKQHQEKHIINIDAQWLCPTSLINNSPSMEEKTMLAIPFAHGDTSLHEPPNDKTNKMACAPSEDSDQLGIRPV